tara:strand:+ start:5223 stop:5984 length:762 start_codon:yes stop_codon:yes gene_type:complete
MIKFFRKIRQRLLTENKFSKYLVYAIGEIVLVVIGILIALQINNLNESKKEQNILNASLNSLKLNLQKDIGNLNDQIEYNKSVLEAVDFSFRIISLPEYDDLPLSKFADSVFDISSERTFLPTTTAFNSMESGSHFQWIKTQDLIQSIYNYYALVDKIASITIQNNQFVKNHMEGFTYNNMEFGSLLPSTNPYSKKRNPKLDNTKILRESTIFENALIGRRFRANSEIEVSKDAILKAKELITTIDDYLNVNN